MRVNLVTPFAEKESAKALGARWDPARKVWYVQDVKDLAPFMRWIPDLAAATTAPAAGAPRKAPAHDKASRPASMPGVTTTSAIQRPLCSCDVLPWEPCAHTGA